jgi:hypothetical protein
MVLRYYVKSPFIWGAPHSIPKQGKNTKKKSSLASICHFLVLDPHLKAMGPIYGSYTIGLLYLIGP